MCQTKLYARGKETDENTDHCLKPKDNKERRNRRACPFKTGGRGLTQGG